MRMMLARLACLVLSIPMASPAAASGGGAVATYDVHVERTHPPRLSVVATLPVEDGRLRMTASWPGNVPRVDQGGWPALVEGLVVRDAAGAVVEAERLGPEGWRLDGVDDGVVRAAYVVDYADVAGAGWPAPRETAYGTGDRFVVLGRSLFVTGAEAAPRVRFHLPERWTVAVPWTRGEGDWFAPGSTAALVENLVTVGGDAPMRVEAGGFAVDVVAFGHWMPVAGGIEAALRATLRDYVRRMDHAGEGGYLVALLPAVERGGEAFRDSFALNWNEAPSATNRADWANTIAHELFHAWNGTRMRGADYAASQWFQEGFTEYMANTTLHATGQVDDAGHRARIARHIENYGRLETPLDAPGTRKGPPLYSGGALVAYTWDAMIREATGGERSLDDVMRALWRRTGGGAAPYGWADIEAALSAVAPGDWAGFHARHIAGTEPLPIDRTLAAMGLQRTTGAEGATAVTAMD